MNYSLKHQTVPVKNPTSHAILLHGYGANGADLLDLAPIFQQTLPNTTFIAPDAPNRCAQNPSGFEWFCLKDFSPTAMMQGAEQAIEKLINFLDSVITQHNIEYKDLILIGFSQGSAMALHSLLKLKDSPKAIVSFSGFLAHNAPTLNTDTPCPVHLIHGDQDMVVPDQASKVAQQQLKDLGVKASYHECRGLGHGINEEGLTSAIQFLKPLV